MSRSLRRANAFIADAADDSSASGSDREEKSSSSSSSSSLNRDTRNRRWVFTINNYSASDVTRLKSLFDDGKVKYIIFQAEVGAQGTPHLQGYVEVSSLKSLKQMKVLIGGSATSSVHLEIARGTPQQCADYCRKDDTAVADSRFEAGNISQQGKRTDLITIANTIKEKGLSAAIDANPASFLKFPNGMVKYANHLISKIPKVPPKVFWFFGDTGLGKSRMVREMCKELVPDEQPFSCSRSLQWLDGYSGQKCAILDDYRGDWAKIHELNRLLDRYEVQVPVKGGFVQWVPHYIFITSIHTPEQCYPNSASDTVEQINRRIHVMRRFGKSKGVVCYRDIWDKPVDAAAPPAPVPLAADDLFDDEQPAVMNSAEVLDEYGRPLDN